MRNSDAKGRGLKPMVGVAPPLLRLVLFDIDGTLLTARRVFRAALGEALRACFGTEGPIESFEFSGKTDPQIVRELMRGAGLDERRIDSGLADALGAYEARLLSRLDGDAVSLKPGVIPLLERLAADDRGRLALLTGNLEPCAWAKLELAGIRAFFAFGAFGSDDEDRYNLAKIALERGRRHLGYPFRGNDLVIVGDSVHDVRCGRSIGVRAVAVATGATGRDRLQAEGPDALLDDFRDTEGAARAILED
jgi:phosphoglycolate phosphatase